MIDEWTVKTWNYDQYGKLKTIELENASEVRAFAEAFSLPLFMYGRKAITLYDGIVIEGQ